MSAGLQNRLAIQILINGEEVPLKDNIIDTIHIVESVRIYVPMLTLVIKDVIKFFTYKNLLVDGAPIEITLESAGRREVFYFRLFNHSESTPQGILTYTIYGYLDAPRYWTESAITPIRGTVSSVLGQICTSTKLTYDGPTTADSQLWIPANKKYAQFAQSVAEHGWMSESSCCQMVVTFDRVMRLRDVSKMATLDPVQYFTNKSATTSQTVITDEKVINKAGFYNASSGYRESKVIQSLLAADVVLKDLKLVKNSRQLMVNQAIHANIVQNKVLYAPIDVGNVSQTYERAVYQNRRLSNLFSFGIEFVTMRPVDAQVLDVINCELAKPEVEGVEAYNGKYVLASKVTYVVGFNRYTKCEVLRHGLNTSQDTQM